MRSTLLAATALLGFSLPVAANAALIASFSQNPSGTPTVVTTDNGTVTNIDITNISTAVTAGEIVGNTDFSFHATSIDPAATLGSAVIQHYSGSFCFTSANNCGGTNFLSGVFSDAAFGALGGPGLVVNVNNPPDTLTLTSSTLTASDLAAPNTFGLTFANLAPVLALNGTTIAAFTADFSGTVSSSTVAASEPGGLALMGVGLLGLTFLAKRRNSRNYF
jgi:hypothetical protein